MKKVLFVLLSAVLLLCSCGNKTQKIDGQKTQSISLNETVKTNNFEITLEDVMFANSIDDKPTNSSNSVSLGNGKEVIVFLAKIKYIGKSNLTTELGKKMSVAYGDGYVFEDYEIYLSDSDNSFNNWELKCVQRNGTSSTLFTDFKPLSETIYQVKGYFEVPSEVKDNETEPLSINLNFSGDYFSYTMR